MKNISLFLGVVLLSFSAIAGELSGQDAGTYVILGPKRIPTEFFYRLSKNGEKWVAEGKRPGEKNWVNISHSLGGEYRVSTESEIQSYFPPDWIANAQISCIQNMAQAFCRYTSKNDSAKTGHVMVALVTKPPIVIFLHRVFSASMSRLDQPAQRFTR